MKKYTDSEMRELLVEAVQYILAFAVFAFAVGIAGAILTAFFNYYGF